MSTIPETSFEAAASYLFQPVDFSAAIDTFLKAHLLRHIEQAHNQNVLGTLTAFASSVQGAEGIEFLNGLLSACSETLERFNSLNDRRSSFLNYATSLVAACVRLGLAVSYPSSLLSAIS